MNVLPGSVTEKPTRVSIPYALSGCGCAADPDARQLRRSAASSANRHDGDVAPSSFEGSAYAASVAGAGWAGDVDARVGAASARHDTATTMAALWRRAACIEVRSGSRV